MTLNEMAMFDALREGSSLNDAIAIAGLDEHEQRRLLPKMLAAATVLTHGSEIISGIHVTPEMLNLWEGVTAPIVEAINDQEAEMAILETQITNCTQAVSHLAGLMADFMRILIPTIEAEESATGPYPALKLVRADTPDPVSLGKSPLPPFRKGGT